MKHSPHPKYSNLRKRSLAELDDVIDEIINRNPEWVAKINRIIEEKKKLNERKDTKNS